jgi:lipoate---protein ligase
MKFLDLTFAEPAANLACDEALLETMEAAAPGAECLRIWEAQNYFVVLGHSNRTIAHVDIAACKEGAIPILRRVSGGGTVVQGPGCLNYALILGNAARRNIDDTFRHVLQRHRRVVEALSGKAARFDGISDLTIDGLKFSGNAQYRKARCALVHGTFLLNFDLPAIERLLPVPAKQPAYRGNRPHRMFVTNLHLDSRELVDALRGAWSADEVFTEVPTTRIEQLTRERYGQSWWSEKF